MIWRPKPGQMVQIRYRKSARAVIPFHKFFGLVEAAGTGPGPINALVWVPLNDKSHRIVIPRGQLFELENEIAPKS